MGPLVAAAMALRAAARGIHTDSGTPFASSSLENPREDEVTAVDRGARSAAAGDQEA